MAPHSNAYSDPHPGSRRDRRFSLLETLDDVAMTNQTTMTSPLPINKGLMPVPRLDGFVFLYVLRPSQERVGLAGSRRYVWGLLGNQK